MNNIETSTKNLNTAKQLLSHMRVLFGKRFDDQWKNVNDKLLIEMTSKIISDLSDEQIQGGVEIMKINPWPPSLPEFRKWCLTSSTNISPNEAWIKALIYEASPETTEISTFTYEALEFLKKGFNTINSTNLNHENSFKEYYTKIVSAALIQNRIDTIILPKKVKNNDREIKINPITIPEHLKIQLEHAFKKTSGLNRRS